ncbi:MAG TPA: type I DNA topoisomerase [Actinomycetota bacterium]|nr:type I DNA topoisomerase [Actinomycetota bacterium]
MPNNLVIVESPAKAKTIEKYLGSDFKVIASVGHVRDLPTKTLAVHVDDDFRLDYTVNEDRTKIISSITKAAKSADAVYLATDYDREGEAIAWHITEACSIPLEKQKRITFTEITKKAVTEAVDHPRSVDPMLVDAQQARRCIDRLVGYPVSQLLWEKIRYGLSAGRVQSVALRMVVEREREISAFIPLEYWTLEALFATDKKETFAAKLVQIGERKIATQISRDAPEDAEGRIPDAAQAEQILAALDGATYQVEDVRTQEKRRSPQPPFITSTYQQEASRKLGYGARRAMGIAQGLYERGFITYMRTDSTTMSQEAIGAAESLIRKAFGPQYWAGRYSNHDRKTKGAQEAHECIRPTEMSMPRAQVEAAIRAEAPRDSEAMIKVYDLVWKRAVSSLMTQAVFDAVSADIVTAGPPQKHVFRATGSTIKFDGFMRIYMEGQDDDEDEEGGKLPALTATQPLDLEELRPDQHFTAPLPRYTEASLIKELESRGIGRPSTYASIMATLVEEKRGYTRLDRKRFFATDTGEVVSDYLTRFFGDHFMDYQFTSDLEEHLDEMAEGRLSYRPVVESFYTPLKDRMAKAAEITKEEVTTQAIDERCPECGSPLVIKLGRTGKFVACTNYPTCKFTRPLPGQEQAPPELLDEDCPDCGNKLQKRTGRFGPFVGCSTYPECKYIKRKPITLTGVPCPKCAEAPCPSCKKGTAGELVERDWKRGKFYGCNHYPRCRYGQTQDPRTGDVSAPGSSGEGKVTSAP